MQYSAPKDLFWLEKAVLLSTYCPVVETSFAVGAVLVDENFQEISSGYSLELGPGWHAEEVALHKAKQLGRATQGATLYSTLEPCSRRLSGKTPCCSLIAKAGIKRVVYAENEPPVFVKCDGESVLKKNGIDVMRLKQLSDRVREINSHLFR